MRVLFFSLSFLVLLSATQAQTKTSFRIRVIENAENGRSLPGVNISATTQTIRSQPVGGSYHVEVIDSRPGDAIELILEKPGYTVINWRHLKTTIPKAAITEPFLLCVDKDYEKWARHYYKVQLEPAIQKKIDDLYTKFSAFAKADKKAQEQILNELAAMQAQAKNGKLTENVVEGLAKQKPGDKDTFFFQTYQLLLNGNFEEARRFVSQAGLEDEARAYEQKAEQLKLEGEILSYKFGLRGDLDMLDLNVEAAIKNYERSLKYYPNNFLSINKLVLLYVKLEHVEGALRWMQKGLEINVQNDDEKLYHHLLSYQLQNLKNPNDTENTVNRMLDSTKGLNVTKAQLPLFHYTRGLANVLIGRESEGLLSIRKAFQLDSNLRFELIPRLVDLYILKKNCKKVDSLHKVLLALYSPKTKSVKDLNAVQRAGYIKNLHSSGVIRVECFQDTITIKQNFNTILKELTADFSPINNAMFLEVLEDYIELFYEDEEENYKSFLEKLLTRFSSISDKQNQGSFVVSALHIRLALYYDDEDDTTNSKRHFYYGLKELGKNINSLQCLLMMSEIVKNYPFAFEKTDSITTYLKGIVSKVRMDPVFPDRDLVLTVLYTTFYKADEKLFSEEELMAMIASDIQSIKNITEIGNPYENVLETFNEAVHVLLDYYNRLRLKSDALKLANRLFVKSHQNFEMSGRKPEQAFWYTSSALDPVIDTYLAHGDFVSALKFTDSVAVMLVQGKEDSIGLKLAVMVISEIYPKLLTNYTKEDSTFLNQLEMGVSSLFQHHGLEYMIIHQKRVDVASLHAKLRNTEKLRKKSS